MLVKSFDDYEKIFDSRAKNRRHLNYIDFIWECLLPLNHHKRS
jgi:hypothetical protein